MEVKPGDTVAINQVLVEIETAKSLVELPSPFAGTVSDSRRGGRHRRGGHADHHDRRRARGARRDAPDDRRRLRAEPADGDERRVPCSSATAEGGHVSSPPPQSTAPASGRVRSASGRASSRSRPIRKLAKDLGVELASVEPTGPAGEVTRDDVVRQASQASVFRNIETPEWGAVREETIAVPAAEPAASASAPRATDDAREESIPVKGVRKAIATAMVSSAFTAPHVSVFVDVDATRTMEFVKRLKDSPDFAGIKVSPLLIMAKAVIWAVRRNPMVNAAWVDATGGRSSCTTTSTSGSRRRRRAAFSCRTSRMRRRSTRASSRARSSSSPSRRATARRAPTTARRHDHDHEHRRVRHGYGHPDPQPG